MGHSAGFGSVPLTRAGFGSNLVCHGANQITIALDHTKLFWKLDSSFKVYGSNINNTNLSLCHQGVKSPISEEKKIGSDSDSQRRMSFKFEYLGNFETEFKNNLGYKTGAQMGSIDEKSQRTKISCYYPFKSFFTYLMTIWEDSQLPSF